MLHNLASLLIYTVWIYQQLSIMKKKTIRPAQLTLSEHRLLALWLLPLLTILNLLPLPYYPPSYHCTDKFWVNLWQSCVANDFLAGRKCYSGGKKACQQNSTRHESNEAKKAEEEEAFWIRCTWWGSRPFTQHVNTSLAWISFLSACIDLPKQLIETSNINGDLYRYIDFVKSPSGITSDMQRAWEI